MSEIIKKNNTAITLITITVLLIAAIIFFQQYKSLEAKKNKEIEAAYFQLDSLTNELDQQILTIKELGGTIDSLGFMIDTLESLKSELEGEKRMLVSRDKSQRKKIASLTDRVAGYKEIILRRDEEIEELKLINAQLVEENSTLKVEKNELSKSINELKEKESELANKVAFASRLQLEGLTVYAVNTKGRERANEFRNRHIEQLKIQFTVLENEIAPIEGKELLLRITAPDGNVLFDVTKGSGSFTFNGRELFYTAKQEILYDKSRQLVTFMYNKGSEFTVGQHQVEVYTADYVIGTGSFVVK